MNMRPNESTATARGALRTCLALMHALGLAALAAPALAQTPPANLLVNGGFEVLGATPPTTCGNNYTVPPWPAGGYPISPWVMTSGNSTNLVAVDGNVTCNYGNSGPATDAEGTPAGTRQHYLDLLADGVVYQGFTVAACPGSTVSRTAQYSGAFSGRDGGAAGTGTIQIVQGTGVGGAVMASQSATGASYQGWTTLSGTVALAPGDYSYVSTFTNPTNFDNAVVSLTPCPAVPPAPVAVPANAPWALLLAALGVGWLARRRLSRG